MGMKRIASLWLPSPVADRTTLEGLAAACLCYTPWSAVDDWTGQEGGGLWLDISGCAHLHGGEEPLLQDLLDRFRRYGFAVRAAIAETPGAAWAWARFGDAARPCLPQGCLVSILSPLPLPALRLQAATVTGLNRLGLKTIGTLAAQPRVGLTARFGLGPVHRLDQALGRKDEPISPQQPVEIIRTHLRFAEPIARPEDIAAAVHHLLDDLCRTLTQQRLGVRRLDLTAFCIDGSRRHFVIGTGRPNRDPRHLFRLLAEPLAKLDAGFGLDLLSLSATEAAPLAAEQAALPYRPSQEKAPPSPQDRGEGDAAGLNQLFDTLGNRLGFSRIRRFAVRQSHLPERAVRLLPPQAPATTETWPADRRPLRLFVRPESIEAVAPLPDAPPMLFRWRRKIHRIIRAEGPERLVSEWWRENRPERDYYCVEDEKGCRFWLYREGAYGGTTAPSWFLHGIFP
jgi:protein ImuB